MSDTGGQPLDYAPIRRTPEVNWRRALAVAATASAVIIVVLLITARVHRHPPPTSSHQLRMIGHWAIGYAADHDGHYPDSFETLVASDGDQPWLPPAYFASPNGPATPAPDYETMFREPGHISYVWIGAGLAWDNVELETPLAYEGPVTDFEAGTLVFFVDASVRRVNGEELRKLLSDAEARLGSATTVPSTRPATSPTTTPTSCEGPGMFGK